MESSVVKKRFRSCSSRIVTSERAVLGAAWSGRMQMMDSRSRVEASYIAGDGSRSGKLRGSGEEMAVLGRRRPSWSTDASGPAGGECSSRRPKGDSDGPVPVAVHDLSDGGVSEANGDGDAGVAFAGKARRATPIRAQTWRISWCVCSLARQKH